MNIDDLGFLKLQLSQGPLKDEDGKRIGSCIIFRPDIDIEKQYFFEYTEADRFLLCVGAGQDGYPVDCKQVFQDLDGLFGGEYKPIPDDEILAMFKVCCQLLSKKRDEDKLEKEGKGILDDMLPSGEK